MTAKSGHLCIEICSVFRLKTYSRSNPKVVLRCFNIGYGHLNGGDVNCKEVLKNLLNTCN